MANPKRLENIKTHYCIYKVYFLPIQKGKYVEYSFRVYIDHVLLQEVKDSNFARNKVRSFEIRYSLRYPKISNKFFNSSIKSLIRYIHANEEDWILSLVSPKYPKLPNGEDFCPTFVCPECGLPAIYISSSKKFKCIKCGSFRFPKSVSFDEYEKSIRYFKKVHF